MQDFTALASFFHSQPMTFSASLVMSSFMFPIRVSIVFMFFQEQKFFLAGLHSPGNKSILASAFLVSVLPVCILSPFYYGFPLLLHDSQLLIFISDVSFFFYHK